MFKKLLMNLTLTRFLSQLKNTTVSKKELIVIKYNENYIPLIKILYKEGFIQNFTKIDNNLYLRFRYYYNSKGLRDLKIISTLSKITYLDYIEVSKIYKKNKLLVLSTSRGVLTSIECIKYKIGGVLLFIC